MYIYIYIYTYNLYTCYKTESMTQQRVIVRSKRFHFKSGLCYNM